MITLRAAALTAAAVAETLADAAAAHAVRRFPLTTATVITFLAIRQRLKLEREQA